MDQIGRNADPVASESCRRYPNRCCEDIAPVWCVEVSSETLSECAGDDLDSRGRRHPPLTTPSRLSVDWLVKLLTVYSTGQEPEPAPDQSQSQSKNKNKNNEVKDRIDGQDNATQTGLDKVVSPAAPAGRRSPVCSAEASLCPRRSAWSGRSACRRGGPPGIRAPTVPKPETVSWS